VNRPSSVVDISILPSTSQPSTPLLQRNTRTRASSFTLTTYGAPLGPLSERPVVRMLLVFALCSVAMRERMALRTGPSNQFCA
jgi:hypothetical protein